MKMRYSIAVIVGLMAIALTPSRAAEPGAKVHNDKGYYKDIFMDGGIMLNSRTDL